MRRPSSRNKSPYVGDVRLPDGREAIAHMPSMDMGGKCASGVACVVRAATTKKGELVGADALGPHGTPKCEFILQLIRVEEPENEEMGGVWVGAHPSIGERVVESLIRRGSLEGALGKVSNVQSQATKVAGTDMRCDFLLTHDDGEHTTKTVLEVKTVVDTDYNPETPPSRTSCVFFGPTPYSRAGIFPWGRAQQKGPDGEKVVSARAIKHTRELAKIARGELKDEGGTPLRAAICFIVARVDASQFRVNYEACSSFARHLHDARAAGVNVLAHRIRWGEGENLGKAFCAGSLPVTIPEASQS